MSDDKLLKIAAYIIENETTVREAEKVFGEPKSTIHYGLRNRLPKLSWSAYVLALIVLNINLAERAHRGGVAATIKHGPIKYRSNHK